MGLQDALEPRGDAPRGGGPDAPAEPTPLLVVDVTPADGGTGSAGGVSLQVPAGAVTVPTTVTIYAGPPDGAVSGLEPALDSLATPAAPLRFEPSGSALLAPATVTVSVPAEVGDTPGGRAAILRRAPDGTWALAGDAAGPLIGAVAPGPAVRYAVTTLDTYAVAVVPADRAGCVGAVAVSCADGDGDGVPDVTDRCPAAADPAQGDADGDGVGDACDVCRDVVDPGQVDSDGNGVGDACDLCWAAGGPVQCDDGKPCNGAETCDPADGCLAGEPPTGCCATDADCDDGSSCNGLEWCDDDATCRTGTSLQCDDGNACNGAETCDPAKGCVAGVAPTCGDGNICNGIESCDPTDGCVAGAPVSCADDSACTLEQCDPTVGCVTTMVVCDDGNLCNGVESCDGAVGCVAGTPPACDDGKPCNGLEVCDPDVGCVIGDPPAGCCKTSADCDDGNPCNGSGVCDSGTGQCVVTPPPTCSDGNACNGAESCDPQLGCIAGVPPTCNDGNACNGAETCDPVLGCVAGAPLVCASTNLCAGVAMCDPQLGCVQGPPLHCDDNNVCNGVEVCDPVAGCIGGVALLCDDALPCNGQETCDPLTGCAPGKALPGCCTDGAACDDQNPCNGQWTCGTATGTCELVVQPPGCVQGNACGGVGYCHPLEGCLVTTKLDCSDGNACNGAELCDEALGCVAGTPPACDDGNACDGTEACDPALGCVAGSPPVCSDGNVCNGVESCAPEVGCVPGVVVDCQDPFACTDDACDPVLGCSHVASASCSVVVTVTPEDGGVAQAAETELALMVPGGAVTEPVTITVEAAPWLDGAVAETGETVRSAHSFGPDGTVFAAPITVTLPAPPGAVVGDTFVVLTLDPDSGGWIHATHADGSAIVGVAGGDPLSVTLTLDHFTDYGLGEGCDTCCAVDADCDDGLPCTRDQCVDAACVSSDDPALCDDGDPCTEDACSGGQCAHPAGTGELCDDGDPCTVGDVCAAGTCAGAPVVCDHGPGPCATGVCSGGQCSYAPDDALCGDENPCTLDTCDGSGHCVYAPVAGACDDGDPCTSGDACDGGGCLGVAVPCDDGDPCTDDVCVEGACEFTPRDCDDGVACTTDACDGGDCTSVPDDGPCDDANPCTTDACLLVVGCRSSDAHLCDDGNPCTADTCEPDGSCTTAALPSQPCNDGDKCTTSDVCREDGTCAGTPTPCSDGNLCTDDVCDGATGACSYPSTCDDGIPCTIESCIPFTGECTTTLQHDLCDDGDPCTDDTCAPGGCGHAPGIGDCDDGDPCTADTCVDGGCTHTPTDSAPCDDDDACTEGDACTAGGVCVGDAVNCSDGTPCTLDSCDPLTGCAHTPLEGIGCSDGDPCTTQDTCSNGECKGKTKCDDGFPCTADACDPSTGSCSAPPLVCDDGDDCTADACDPVAGCTYTTKPECVDTDADGTPDVLDCAPWDATVHAGATELCNQRDDDCSGGVDDGACAPGWPCAEGAQCTTGLCLPSSPGGPGYCVPDAGACLQPLVDGIAAVTPSGSVGCASATATGTCNAGVWGSASECPPELPQCAGGACAECAPGARACAGDLSLLCGPSGTFDVDATCVAPLGCYGQGACAITADTLVNHVTTGVNSASEIAVRPDDSFLVVWDRGGIQGRWFAKTGEPHPERPNQFALGPTGGGQFPTAVAVRPDGMVGVAASGGAGVWLRRLGPTVTVDGPTVIVDPNAIGADDLAVAALDGGAFAVAWKKSYSIGTSVVDPVGGTATAAAAVDSYTGSEVNYWPTAIVGTSGGGYAVIWAEYKVIPNAALFMRRYTANGQPEGPKTEILTGTGVNDTQPFCARTGDDAMRCAWSANGAASGVFDGNGAVVEPFIKASTGGSKPRVAVSKSGRFVVSWEGNYDVYARVYEADGTPAGAAVLLENTTWASTLEPRCGAFSDDRFVCTWTDIISGGQTTYVRMQMLD